jgi:hypothetical protein
MTRSRDRCAEAVPESARALVESDEYRAQLLDKNFPELANTFLCYALLPEPDKIYEAAAWASIHAAWTCDDARAETSGTRTLIARDSSSKGFLGRNTNGHARRDWRV